VVGVGGGGGGGGGPPPPPRRILRPSAPYRSVPSKRWRGIKEKSGDSEAEPTPVFVKVTRRD